MNHGIPTNLTDDPRWHLHWQMSNAERCALPTILDRLKPRLSLEIGTYQGGSLQVLAQHSETVISVDINPDVAERLKQQFPNVEFRSGDSSRLLPSLVAELNAARRAVQFVLIDGDHSAEGVRRDIEAILQLEVRERLVILMHDGFNPECRRGMREADWQANRNVHYVELDFTVGNFHAKAFDTAKAGSMWGGFACAVLEPDQRVHDLVIQERQKAVFEAVVPVSIYASKANRWGLFASLRRYLSRLVIGNAA
jgi:predicted O-methyltransferase YrrM